MTDKVLCDECIESAKIVESLVDRDVVLGLFESLPHDFSTFNKDIASAMEYLGVRIGLTGFHKEVVIDICDKLSAYLLYRSLEILELDEREREKEQKEKGLH